MDIPHFAYPFTDGCIDNWLFPAFGVVNEVAINIHIQTFE